MAKAKKGKPRKVTTTAKHGVAPHTPKKPSKQTATQANRTY